MPIEINILQAISTTDKSDALQYLQYQDCGFMYFPNKTYTPFV